MTAQERIATLMRQGLSSVAISAILNVPLGTVEEIAAGGVSGLPATVTIPDVQSALDSGTLVVPGGGGSGPVAHDYVSDGDTNGIFYALGTLGGSFTNPAPAAGGGPVASSESGILSPWSPPPHAEYLTDRDSSVNIFHSSANAPSNWCMWDFIGRRVKLREYTVRSRWDSSLAWPSGWTLQGSNDGAAWTDLDAATPNYTAVDQWKHFTCDVVPTDPFRYVRLLDTADAYLVLGEVELYGDLYS